jgi:hypothetical protein
MRALVASAVWLPALLGAQPADLVVRGGRIYTADTTRWTVDALAVRGGRVVYAGDAAGAARFTGPATRILDLRGATVIPGMVDAHAHVVNLGQSLRNVDLVGTTSLNEVVDRVAARARTTPKGEWIVGRGWDQNDWVEKAFPSHDLLSQAVPDHPVVLTRIDGHASLANAEAMRRARVTAETRWTGAGGRIERTAGGAPTGVFIDDAMALIGRHVPGLDARQIEEAVLLAQREMHRWGLTGVHDAGATGMTVDVYDRLAREGRLRLRLYAMLTDSRLLLDEWFARGPLLGAHDGRLWVRSVKAYADGALGSRGAALLADYSDDPGNTGLLRATREHLQDLAARALAAGFQVNTHAIGDRANRIVLDAYTAAFAARPARDHRFRIEHAQIVAPDDLARFARLGVIPSMQASHQTSDMYWAEQRLGPERITGAYAWRSLLRTGVIIPNGSDFPVELVNPLISFHASVTRQDAKDWPAGGWYPAERMTRREALLSMTAWPAWAAFQEAELGTLAVGKRADFVVLDQDILEVPAERILATQVRGTWVGGAEVYRP